MQEKETSPSKTIRSRLREAELYYSMRLLDEALEAYENILADMPEPEDQEGQAVKSKIQLIKKEMDGKGKEEISAEDLSVIRETVSNQKGPEDIYQSAMALNELGLLEEAIAQYERLFGFDWPPRRVIPELTECLFQIYPPEEVVKRVEKLIDGKKKSKSLKAECRYHMGMEMAKRGHNHKALGLLKTASKMDPENKEIRDRLYAFVSRFSAGSRYDYLIDNKIVTPEQLQDALAISKKTKKSVEFVLIEQFGVQKDMMGKSLSTYYDCPFRTFDPELPVPSELLGSLKKAFLLHDRWVPLNWDKRGVEVLVDDPKDLRKTGQIGGLLRTNNINFSVGIKEDIEQYIHHFFEKRYESESAEIEEELDVIPDIAFEEEEEVPEEEQELLDEASSQVVKLVDQILVTAYRNEVSDIHIEPSPNSRKTNIRFRLDGVCQEYLQVPVSMARGILSRLKIMAGLDIAERRLPQDGKIKFKRKGIPVFELRMSTMPTAGGFEDAVLRILTRANVMSLDDMGMNERNLEVIKRIIESPYGMVLVVGPTGSGKTTTLHACLGHINRPGIKIWTAEDPIEITQTGLRQVEVKPRIGLNFARIMRGFLRLDPDVIMIGEMRDEETAGIGIEASLTGHLVFSTLHTNSAPETITRLLDMGLNPLNFSDAFLGVLAQRLVRRLCDNCREAYHPSKEEIKDIVSEYGGESFKNTGIELSSDLELYRPVGCENCSGTGYRGRMGIHELLTGSAVIKRLIKQQATTEELFEEARKEGMTTLKQDGVTKVLQGLTDLSEVKRVCVD